MQMTRPRNDPDTVYVTFKQKGSGSKTVTVYRATIEEVMKHFTLSMPATSRASTKRTPSTAA